MSRSPKAASTLPSKTSNRLNAYALAASAAGVGLLALAPSADAEIVYTPVHATIGRNGSYNLDLSNDGRVEFTIREMALTRPFGTSQILAITPANGNLIKCAGCVFTSFYTAQALNAGSQIGPVGQSVTFLSFRAEMADRAISNGNSLSFYLPWADVQGKFLGLMFHLSDGDHFGWARVSVTFHKGSRNQRSWDALITGYAYETDPEKPIRAGQIDDGQINDGQIDDDKISDDQASGQISSDVPPVNAGLGSLALGAEGIAMWRRED